MQSLMFVLLVLSLPLSVRAETLCVATYNLNFANRRGDQVLDAIAAAQPDLICFQETTFQSERFLKRNLAKTHPYFYSSGHEGRNLAERFAFACKSELTQLKYTPPDAGLFGFYSANLDIKGETIHIVNIHLTPFQFNHGGGLFEAMAALKLTEEAHTSEIESIAGTLDVNRPTIVVGDFNSVSTYAAPKHLSSINMIDAFASVHEDADTHPTWHWPTQPVPLLLRIDYIFHSSHFATQKAEVVRREGSDHSLIYTILERVK